MDIEKRCDKCKKECPVNKEKSNQNWKVYKEIEKCKCGGEYKMFAGEQEI